MPTVIDALVVTLGLDGSKYKAGQEAARMQLKLTSQEAARAGKEMEASGKQAAQFYAQVKNEALGLVGVLLGAGSITAFAANATRSLAELGREARNIGLSATELGAFRQMIERNGGSAESAAQSMKGLVDQIERFKIFGDPAVFKFLTPIGASIDETPLQIYMKFVKFAEDHKSDVPLVNLIGKGLGFDQGLINATMQIGSLTEAQRQLREESTRSPTPEMTKNAIELEKAWEDLRHQAVFTADSILDRYSPALRSALVAGKDLIKQNPELITAMTAIVGGLTTIAAVRISARLLGLTGLATSLGLLVTTLERLAPLLLLLGIGHGGGTLGDRDEFGNLIPGEKPYVPPGHSEGGYFGDDIRRWWRRHAPTRLGGSPTVTTADTAMTPERKAFLDTLAAGESTSYDDKNPTSAAHGRYQFLNSTDAEVSEQTGLHGNDPVSQDRKAWFLAATTYQRNTGRDLEADVKAGGHESEIAAALRGVWPSLPGGSQQNTTAHQFRTRLRDNLSAYTDQARQTGAGASPTPPPAAAPQPLPTIDPALQLRPGAAAQANAPPSPQVTNSVQIGDVTLHTQAKDAPGVARDLKRYVDDAFSGDVIPMSNRGLQ